MKIIKPRPCPPGPASREHPREGQETCGHHYGSQRGTAGPARPGPERKCHLTETKGTSGIQTTAVSGVYKTQPQVSREKQTQLWTGEAGNAGDQQTRDTVFSSQANTKVHLKTTAGSDCKSCKMLKM